MRAVIDTNVLIAGLLWRGPPHALLTHVRNGLVSLISSPALLAELDDVLGRAKFDAILTRTNTARDQALAGGVSVHTRAPNPSSPDQRGREVKGLSVMPAPLRLSRATARMSVFHLSKSIS